MNMVIYCIKYHGKYKNIIALPSDTTVLKFPFLADFLTKSFRMHRVDKNKQNF